MTIGECKIGMLIYCENFIGIITEVKEASVKIYWLNWESYGISYTDENYYTLRSVSRA
jgi:hypothetical protein